MIVSLLKHKSKMKTPDYREQAITGKTGSIDHLVGSLSYLGIGFSESLSSINQWRYKVVGKLDIVFKGT